MITEFARDFLAQRGVKVLVPGEKERVVVSLSEETNEDEKNGAEEATVTVTVGEKCEVCSSALDVSAVIFQQEFIEYGTSDLKEKKICA